MLLRWREWLGLNVRVQDLATLLIREFAKRGSSGWTYDESERTLRHPDQSVVNLANLHLEYSQAPRSNRAFLLAKYANFAKILHREIPKLWELASKAIYPIIRSRHDMVAVEIDLRDNEEKWPELVSWPLVDDLVVRIAYDWGSQVSPVNAERFEMWGQPLDVVRARALQNLAALANPIWRELGKGVFQLESDESYEETFMLVEKAIERLPFKESAACIPSNRGVLLACDLSKSDDVVAMIEEAIRNNQEKPWPLSGVVMTRKADTWSQCLLEGIAAVRAGDLYRINLAGIYDSQKTALDAHFKKKSLDVYVGRYNLFRRPQDGGAIRSWCSWSDGVHASLPKADFVIVGKAEDQSFAPVVVPWDSAAANFESRMTNTDESPARFLVDGTFTAEDWAVLAKLAG
jgi:hypothetical protein